ncbi:hypothetical protein BIY26_14870 [Brenneria goodwinii]|uniref:Uncharacterized protein n=1 Tax=Brenneria goodwinii TaxID=1109412 RepID=A0AAE8EQE4_9GAMM|nr:hypothetical protein [Brenneria goodwinii]ATA25811.1 hypothetical protein AWC36_17780 [Brenneria goodwinii]RLM21153.1 hypothetical protein BIY26_14870 [Brenneria goodwinii]
MYHSDLIIRDMQAGKLMALQLEKALSGVKVQVLEQADKIGDGATRLLYYLSCYTDNYQDICAKLKVEDIRFFDGLQQLIKDRNIILEMFKVYIELLFENKTPQQLEYIKRLLMKANVYISTSTLTNQAFALGITMAICLGFNVSMHIRSRVGSVSGAAAGGLGIYGIIQDAADSAQRLQMMSSVYYQALYLRNLEMMYFLIEPIFIKSSAFKTNILSDDDVAKTIINMVK